MTQTFAPLPLAGWLGRPDWPNLLLVTLLFTITPPLTPPFHWLQLPDRQPGLGWQLTLGKLAPPQLTQGSLEAQNTPPLRQNLWLSIPIPIPLPFPLSLPEQEGEKLSDGLRAHKPFLLSSPWLSLTSAPSPPATRFTSSTLGCLTGWRKAWMSLEEVAVPLPIPAEGHIQQSRFINVTSHNKLTILKCISCQYFQYSFDYKNPCWFWSSHKYKNCPQTK